jgi:hypothetical protein
VSGRYWARTSDPQLVESGRPFAPVRTWSLNGLARRFGSDALPRRERARTWELRAVHVTPRTGWFDRIHVPVDPRSPSERASPGRRRAAGRRAPRSSRVARLVLSRHQVQVFRSRGGSAREGVRDTRTYETSAHAARRSFGLSLSLWGEMEAEYLRREPSLVDAWDLDLIVSTSTMNETIQDATPRNPVARAMTVDERPQVVVPVCRAGSRAAATSHCGGRWRDGWRITKRR